jgi:ATP-dependent DNA ligase
MAATLRLTCTHTAPKLLQWAEKINMHFRPPHAMIDGQETHLNWDEPIDLQVAPGQLHKLEVYFRVFDLLRMCGADLEIEPLQEGETRCFEYSVELKDRYLNRGHLNRVT